MHCLWIRYLVTRFKHCFTKDCIKNAYLDQYVCSGFDIGFDSWSEFSLPDGNLGKNVIIFEVNMSSSVHIDNKRKDILILDEGLIQGLDDTTL